MRGQDGSSDVSTLSMGYKHIFSLWEHLLESSAIVPIFPHRPGEDNVNKTEKLSEVSK